MTIRVAEVAISTMFVLVLVLMSWAQSLMPCHKLQTQGTLSYRRDHAQAMLLLHVGGNIDADPRVEAFLNFYSTSVPCDDESSQCCTMVFRVPASARCLHMVSRGDLYGGGKVLDMHSAQAIAIQ